jgi:hypothetical protein
MQVLQRHSHGAPFSHHQSEVIVRSLDHLMAMAQRFRTGGDLRQAMEIYWSLFEDHFNTAQGQAAEEELLNLAEFYEREGFSHQARAVYERLI